MTAAKKISPLEFCYDGTEEVQFKAAVVNDKWPIEFYAKNASFWESEGVRISVAEAEKLRNWLDKAIKAIKK